MSPDIQADLVYEISPHHSLNVKILVCSHGKVGQYGYRDLGFCD